MQRSKYLVASKRDTLWGLTASTVGYEEIAPHDDYPTTGHADGYYFRVADGRVLSEYQLQYVVSGEGSFTTLRTGTLKLRAGDMFLLFPNEWHTYRPNPATGWNAYWIGFTGKNMDARVAAHFLTADHPVYHIGFSDEMVKLYRTAYRVALQEETNHQQVLAGIVNYMIGLMYSLARIKELSIDSDRVNIVNQARLIIRESLDKRVSMQEVAHRVGCSYSTFRKIFKEYTGLSPTVYQQELRLQRAKDLLAARPDLSVKEIAYLLDFESADYFSTKFRKKMGLRPTEYREQTLSKHTLAGPDVPPAPEGGNAAPA